KEKIDKASDRPKGPRPAEALRRRIESNRVTTQPNGGVSNPRPSQRTWNDAASPGTAARRGPFRGDDRLPGFGACGGKGGPGRGTTAFPRENFTDNKGSAAFNRRHFPHPNLRTSGFLISLDQPVGQPSQPVDFDGHFVAVPQPDPPILRVSHDHALRGARQNHSPGPAR